MSMLDAICSLFVSQSSAKTWRWLISSSVHSNTSHNTLFQTVGVRHQGHLPVEFFDWVRGWQMAQHDFRCRPCWELPKMICLRISAGHGR
jgi:hypothetical protein